MDKAEWKGVSPVFELPEMGCVYVTFGVFGYTTALGFTIIVLLVISLFL